MKKKSTVTGYKAITPFTLYLRDVHDLHDVVAAVSTTVAIETDEFTDIKSLEELAEALPGPTRRVKSLHLIGSKRGVARIRVTASEQEGLVVLENDAPDLIGAQEKAKRIMWRHAENWALASVWPPLTFILAFAGAITLMSEQYVWAASFAAAAAAVAGIGWTLGKTRFAKIYMVEQAQAPGLLARNRDILLMLAGVILGLLAPVALAAVRGP